MRRKGDAPQSKGGAMTCSAKAKLRSARLCKGDASHGEAKAKTRNGVKLLQWQCTADPGKGGAGRSLAKAKTRNGVKLLQRLRSAMLGGAKARLCTARLRKGDAGRRRAAQRQSDDMLGEGKDPKWCKTKSPPVPLT